MTKHLHGAWGFITRGRREGREIRPIAMGENLFRLEGLDNFRIRCERDEAGRVVTLVGLCTDGRQEPSQRTARR